MNSPNYPEHVEFNNCELNPTETFNAEKTQKETKFPKRFGKTLTRFLWLQIGFDLLFFLYILFWATANYIYDVLDTIDTTRLSTYWISGLINRLDRK